MIRHISKPTTSMSDISSRPQRLARGLQAFLWTLWTLAVVSSGVWSWWADTMAGRPLSLLGMAINAILVGVIGLIVLIKIEMRLEPWRFLE
jgi:multisubunit Na+/H+ antiporter MnhB subunit